MKMSDKSKKKLSKPKRDKKELSKPKRDPWGCMAGTVTIMPGVDLTEPADPEWGGLYE